MGISRFTGALADLAFVALTIGLGLAGIDGPVAWTGCGLALVWWGATRAGALRALAAASPGRAAGSGLLAIALTLVIHGAALLAAAAIHERLT